MRWSKGGSRAATGGGDPATAANRPEGGAGSGNRLIESPNGNDAAQIQALLHTLSQVRLAVSADLSAAAGALEDERADIAAEVIAGARGELADLRAQARGREHAPSPFPRKPAAPPARVPGEQPRRPSHRLARALAGAAALVVAIAVVPQITRGAGHPAPGAAGVTAVQPSPDIRLASSEFTTLSRQLLAADAAPATILAAERSWQGAIAGSLPSASTSVTAASAIVTMLRRQRALILASPALRVPANRELATSLAASSQNLLARLRRLADPHVLAALPTVLGALPLPGPDATTAPAAGASPTPATSDAPTGPTSSTGTGSLPTPADPGSSAPTPPLPSPIPGPGQVPPVPLPSTLGQLTGGAAGDGDLGQTVGNVLNGLGLGG